MTEIFPPPSAADIERMARHVIATQAAFKRACEATEAANKAMALLADKVRLIQNVARKRGIALHA